MYFRAVARGAQAPQFLADQLTLSQPGGQILPTQYYEPPQIFRPCNGSDGDTFATVYRSKCVSVLL